MTKVWLPVLCVLCLRPPQQLCDDCRSKIELRFRAVKRPIGISGFAVTNYESQAGALVRAFKKLGSKTLLSVIAEPMAEFLVLVPKRHLVLVPAPSSKSNFKQRGYVPAQLIAKGIRRRLLAMPLDSRGWETVSVSNVLRLTEHSDDQAGLNRQERIVNLAGKMRASSSPRIARLAAGQVSREPPSVVLIDDIVTTGSTLREMNRSLRLAGWNPEFFLTFSETL